MIELPFVKNRTVAVMGLGKSGMTTAKILHRNGATVWAWDDNAETRKLAADENLQLVDLAHTDLSKIDFLVLSPGIPLTHPQPHPVAINAQKHDVEIIGDIELLQRAKPKCTYI